MDPDTVTIVIAILVLNFAMLGTILVLVLHLEDRLTTRFDRMEERFDRKFENLNRTISANKTRSGDWKR